MIKTGKEIWGDFIKTSDNTTSERIKKLHYDINQVLYVNNRRYISPQSATRILDLLKKYGVALKELNVDGKYKKKKEEILAQLRDICNNLIKYRKTFIWNKDDSTAINNTLRFQVKQYIDNKETLKTKDYLDRNREIWREIYEPFPFKELVGTKHFLEMQSELIERSVEQFRERYNLSA